MKKDNLYCLSVRDKNFTHLDFLKIDQAPKELEVDLENKRWRNHTKNEKGDEWKEIGENGGGDICLGCDIRLVFDITNVSHIEKSLEVMGNFHR